MAIYFLALEARPGENSDDYGRVAGAYISCWIQCDAPSEARAIAADDVEQEGWIVDSIEQEPKVLGSATPGTEERFEQAKIDGCCYVYHTWSKEARQ
ncbi:MAG TPA: hypothetical protein VL199_11570 [Burkholderiales bacterium]|jgi:hypothetical protein|nr:hypothetical protein [Burkholderiales bacterium]HTM60991.1 hypothetical protein [Burkholderiales bacterium]